MPQTTEIMDMHPAACIAYLDEGAMHASMLAPEKPPDALDMRYRKLAYGVIMAALTDFITLASGRQIKAKGPLAVGTPKRLAPDEVARAVALAEDLAACPVFGFWCAALGQDPALLVEGVLRKMLRGEALRFAATEEEGRNEMDPPLCGSTSMSHNDFGVRCNHVTTGGESNETSDERTRDRHCKARVSRGGNG
jgi:hypothetical protein